MKRIFTLLLAMLMILSLCACGGTEDGEAKEKFDTLQVGFGKAKIQPPNISIHLTGGGDPNRIATGVLDELYLTCFAITDTDGTTLLIYTVDIQNADVSWSIPAREFISEHTGVPVSNIIFGSTHAHSVPGLNTKTEANKKYNEVFEAGLIKATDDALADRSDAEIQVGTADGIMENGKKLAYVRHYVMKDGSVYGSNFGSSASGFSGEHPYDADIQAQLLKFVRPAEDKKDVLMVSWPCHSTFNGTTALKNLSADWPSPTRDYIEANSDCLVGIFLGGAGNQVPNSADPYENHQLDYRAYGAALGQIIVDALPNTTKVEDGTIKITSKEFVTESNIYTGDKLADAVEAYNYFLENGQAAGNTFARSKGFESCYHARAIVQRSKLGPTKEATLSAISLGNLSFIVAPYEMFSKSAQEIKNKTPFDMTFLLCYANGAVGYIPTTEGYDYNDGIGCYEAYSSGWPKGAAEELSAEYLKLLDQLKAE